LADSSKAYRKPKSRKN